MTRLSMIVILAVPVVFGPEILSQVPPKPESPEHSFARQQFESLQTQFTQSRAEFDQAMRGNPDCKIFADLDHHPVTRADISEHMVSCNRDSVSARYVMEKVRDGVTLAKTQLTLVDECLKVYNITIDMKISDQTMRQSLRIKACQDFSLYPPRTE